MARKTVSIRLAVENQETVLKALRQLGDEGQAALRQIERATAPASRGLLALNAAGKEARGAMAEYADRLGPIGSVMRALGPAGLAAAAGVAGLAVAGGGLVKLANDVSAAGKELEELAAATGVSVEDLSTLQYAADSSGSSLDGLKVGLKALTKNALDAFDGMRQGSAELAGDAKVWRELGIQVTDASGRLRPAYALFLDASTALRGVASDTERAALAQKLFGRAGMELLPLLREGSEGIRELQDRARALGGEFSTQAAEDAARYQDALKDLGVAMGAFGYNIAVDVIPTLTHLTTSLTEIIAKVHELGQTKPIRIPVETPDAEYLLPTFTPRGSATGADSLTSLLRPSTRAALDQSARAGLGTFAAAADAAYTGAPSVEGVSPQATQAVAQVVSARVVPKDVQDLLGAQHQRLLEAQVGAELDLLKAQAAAEQDLAKAAADRKLASEKEIEAGILALRAKHQTDLEALAKKGGDAISKTELEAEQRREIELYRNGKRQQFEVQESDRQAELARKQAKDRLDLDQQLNARRVDLWNQQAAFEEQAQLRHGHRLLAFDRQLHAETVDLLVKQQAEREQLAERKGTLEQETRLRALQAEELTGQMGRTFGAWGRSISSQQQAIVQRYAQDLEALGPISDEAGRQSALQLTQALRRELQVNEDADLKLPFARSGISVAESFRGGFETSLSGAFRTILEGGSLTDALGLMGDGMVQSLIGAVSDSLAEKVTDELADLVRSEFVEGLTDPVKEAGTAVAQGFTGALHSGLSSFFARSGGEDISVFTRGLRDVLPEADAIEQGRRLGGSMSTGMTGRLVGDLNAFFQRGLPANGVPLGSQFARMLHLDTAGGELGTNLGAGISAGLTTALMGKTLQSFGLNLPDRIILTVALADGLAAKLKADADPLGQRIGEGLQTGLTTFMVGQTLNSLTGNRIPTNLVLGVSLSQGFLSEFAPQSPTISRIETAVSGALRGAVIGAGIGRLFGDEITSQHAAIAGSLGQIVGAAIGGSTGGIIGSGIGALVSSVYDMITGADDERKREAEALSEVMTDVAAFGGIAGYIARIGGLSGFTGERVQQFQYGDVQKYFENTLRVQSGLSKEEAGQVMQVIGAAGAGGTAGIPFWTRPGEVESTRAYLAGLFARAGLPIDANAVDIRESGLTPAAGGAGATPTDRTFTGFRDGVFYVAGVPYNGTLGGVTYVNGVPQTGQAAGKVVAGADAIAAATDAGGAIAQDLLDGFEAQLSGALARTIVRSVSSEDLQEVSTLGGTMGTRLASGLVLSLADGLTAYLSRPDTGTMVALPSRLAAGISRAFSRDELSSLGQSMGNLLAGGLTVSLGDGLTAYLARPNTGAMTTLPSRLAAGITRAVAQDELSSLGQTMGGLLASGLTVSLGNGLTAYLARPDSGAMAGLPSRLAAGIGQAFSGPELSDLGGTMGARVAGGFTVALGTGLSAYLAQGSPANGSPVASQLATALNRAFSGQELQDLGGTMGSRLGTGITNALATSLNGRTLQSFGLSIPSSIVIGVSLGGGLANDLAPQSPTVSTITATLSQALRNAVTGASLGPLFSAELTSGASAISAAISQLVTTALGSVTTPPPVAPVSQVPALAVQLATQLAQKKVSKGFLAGVDGDIDAVLAYLNNQGVAYTSGTFADYWRAYATGKANANLPQVIKMASGIDVVAARGFAGTVARPTTFLAGEAGPEDVVIIPQHLRRSVTGGGVEGRNVHLYLTMTVHTPNVQSTDAWARGTLYPMVRQLLMEDSRRGKPLLTEKAIIRN